MTRAYVCMKISEDPPGVLVAIFHFYYYFNKTFCKQTVKILIRHRIMRCLIWVCTVCLCPIKRTLGIYGLKQCVLLVFIILTRVSEKLKKCEPFLPQKLHNVSSEIFARILLSRIIFKRHISQVQTSRLGMIYLH